MILLDVCELIVDCPHSTAQDEGAGYPLIRTPNVGKGRLILDGVHRVCEEVYDERNARAVPQPGDLILAREAPVGNVAVIQSGQRVCLGQRTVLIRPKPEVVDADYLAYYLLSPAMQHLLLTSSNGATVSHLNMAAIRKLNIELPALDVQKKIGRILCCMADKLENNNQINRNLSEQAQSLYKSWFIDFEPFGGAMPKAWREGTLGDLAEIRTDAFKPDKNPTAIVEHYSIPALDEKHFPVFEEASGIKSNKYIVTKNDVLFSKLNPDIKRIWRPYCISDLPVCSTEFMVYRAFKPEYKDFVYSVIDSVPFSQHVCAHTSGSTNSRQRAIPKTTLDFSIPIPSDDIIRQFCDIVTPMYDLEEKGILENQRLADTRDKLLPKLMSGELDVSDIDL